ncbi:hypothetical protein BDV06DRAFT_189772 [Aspergillus oleicola]
MDTEDNPPEFSKHDSTPTAEPSSKPPDPEADEYTSHSSKSRGKFRFKEKSKSSSRSSRHDSRRHRHDRDHRDRHRHHRRTPEDDEDRRRRRHHKHRNHKPRSPSPSTVPSYPGAPLSPNTAFRESLFDALGDDEGAAFWESIYGQSIHSFAAPPGYNGHGRADDENGDSRGELEQMDEEEYASYVRGEMWKRTREGMLEEQERIRAEKRARVNAENVAGEQERRRFERAMEDSLRRGRERKKMKEVWRGVWEDYIRSWEVIEKARNANENESEGKKVRNLLFWPVESGKRRDVTRENVEEFMRRAPPPSGPDTAPEDFLLSTLKTERVRWHPDKIQHRYGALGIDEPVLRSVTEVFQIIDHMWNEQKR